MASQQHIDIPDLTATASPADPRRPQLEGRNLHPDQNAQSGDRPAGLDADADVDIGGHGSNHEDDDDDDDDDTDPNPSELLSTARNPSFTILEGGWVAVSRHHNDPIPPLQRAVRVRGKAKGTVSTSIDTESTSLQPDTNRDTARTSQPGTPLRAPRLTESTLLDHDRMMDGIEEELADSMANMSCPQWNCVGDARPLSPEMKKKALTRAAMAAASDDLAVFGIGDHLKWCEILPHPTLELDDYDDQRLETNE